MDHVFLARILKLVCVTSVHGSLIYWYILLHYFSSVKECKCIVNKSVLLLATDIYAIKMLVETLKLCIREGDNRRNSYSYSVN